MSEATEEEHTTHRSYAIKARFADNAQGTLTFREYVDQCSRNTESAGGETMIRIMKGELGEFDITKTHSDQEMSKYINHLRAWNGRDVPKSWMTIKPNEDASGPAMLVTYQPAAYLGIATAVESANVKIFNALIDSTAGSNANKIVLNHESDPIKDRLRLTWADLKAVYAEIPDHIKLVSKQRLEQLRIYKAGATTNGGATSYRSWNPQDPVDNMFTNLEHMRNEHNRVCRTADQSPDYIQPECEWAVLLPRVKAQLLRHGYEGAIRDYNRDTIRKDNGSEDYDKFKKEIIEQYKNMVTAKQIEQGNGIQTTLAASLTTSATSCS